MTDREELPLKKKASRPKKSEPLQESLPLEATPKVRVKPAAKEPAIELPAKVARPRKKVAPAAEVVVPAPIAIAVEPVAKKRAVRSKKTSEPEVQAPVVAIPEALTPAKSAKARTTKPKAVAEATQAIVHDEPIAKPSHTEPIEPSKPTTSQDSTPKAFGRRPRPAASRPVGSEDASFFLTDMAHMAPAPRPRQDMRPEPKLETTPPKPDARPTRENPHQRPQREGSEQESRRSRGRGRDRKRSDNAPRNQPQAPALPQARANSKPQEETFETAADDDSSVDQGSQTPEPEGRGRRGRGKGRNERQPRNEPQDYGANWCSRRWLEQLERYAHNNDARQRWIRGKVYARRGQVVEIEVGPNGVLAKVQGSRPKPYQVRMELNKLRREAWGRVLIAVASKAQYTARLLAGEMPPEIEQVFASAGARLFPAGDNDLRCKCSCPDPMTPCKHVAAVYHAMGNSLEQDPFLLFSMRGKTKLQFLQDLRDMRFRAQKGAKQTEYTYEELAQMANFWRMGRLNEAVFAHVSFEPGDPARLLHTLGDPPASVVRAGMAMPVLESTYRQVSESIQRLPKDI
jgi:uncharacterized Zn finger protein